MGRLLRRQRRPLAGLVPRLRPGSGFACFEVRARQAGAAQREPRAADVRGVRLPHAGADQLRLGEVEAAWLGRGWVRLSGGGAVFVKRWQVVVVCVRGFVTYGGPQGSGGKSGQVGASRGGGGAGVGVGVGVGAPPAARRRSVSIT